MRATLKHAYFRFYAQLNDFLPCEKKGVTLVCAFQVGGAVKDFVEALGVPHPEIDLILVNGVPAAFSCPVLDADRISVYPRFQSIDIESLTRVRPPALPAARFVTDIHLGRLASYLRMLGFDTLYRNDYRDEELAELSLARARVADQGHRLVEAIRRHPRLLRARDTLEAAVKGSGTPFRPFVRNGAFSALPALQWPAPARPQAGCRVSAAAPNERTLQRISRLPSLWPDLLERIALRTHAEPCRLCHRWFLSARSG